MILGSRAQITKIAFNLKNILRNFLGDLLLTQSTVLNSRVYFLFFTSVQCCTFSLSCIVSMNSTGMLINLVFLLSAYFERDHISTRNPDIYVNLLPVRKRKDKTPHFGVYRSTTCYIK